MTLALIIPTRDGLIIGAESRSAHGPGVYTDSVEKVSVVPQSRCAFIPVGDCEYYILTGRPGDDPALLMKEQRKHGVPEFSAQQVVFERLSKLNNPTLEQAQQEAADALKLGLTKLVRTMGHMLRPKPNSKTVAAVDVALLTYNRNERISTFASVVAAINIERGIIAEIGPPVSIGNDEPSHIKPHGATGFFDALIRPGGHAFISAGLRSRFLQPPAISSVDASEAEGVAHAFLRAASAYASSAGKAEELGGPTMVTLLDGEGIDQGRVISVEPALTKF